MDVMSRGPWTWVLTTPWGYARGVTGTGTPDRRPFVIYDIASMDIQSATKGWHVHQTKAGRHINVHVPFQSAGVFSTSN